MTLPLNWLLLVLQALTYAVQQSCLNKARIVALDEREAGLRATLNLGHTFGHAIETWQGYGEGSKLTLPYIAHMPDALPLSGDGCRLPWLWQVCQSSQASLQCSCNEPMHPCMLKVLQGRLPSPDVTSLRAACGALQVRGCMVRLSLSA